VRYAETDQMGVVHHSAYVVWFEEGRTELSRQTGRSYAEFEQDGFVLSVSELNIRYAAPARYDQLVTIRTRVSEVRSRKVRFDYEVVETDTGQILATGHSAHICLDRDGRPARIPEEWLDFWTGLVVKG
jgi:acyl-CoA thioester hydrolase